MTAIVGHDAAVASFLSAWRAGRAHHAWLLTGPKGVGKARFADLAAARILADRSAKPPGDDALAIPDDHPTRHLLAAGSHPDYRRLERVPNKAGTALARNVSIDQVRSLHELFAYTPSMGSARAVVIDSADDLEPEGANALLKMLEEPPSDTIFFLVSHAPGRLLPTIRSRCRTLEFAPLSDDAMTSILQQERPGDTPQALQTLVALGQGSAGRALAIAEHDLASLAKQARALMCDGDPTGARRSSLAKSLATKAAQDRYREFLSLLPGLIAEEARGAEGARRVALLDGYAEARRTAILAPRLSSDPASTIFMLGTKLAAAAA